MFSNYRYFLVLAEECNVTRAAARLYTTHQNLSKYLANLEKECGVTLFERKPVFSLTYAGKLMFETLRQVELTENNLKAMYSDLREDKGGEVTLGTTEGRFRIIIPDIVDEFKREFPDVTLRVASATSPELREMVMNHQLDFCVAGMPQKSANVLAFDEVLSEKLYLVISDHMLQKYFGADYPQCIGEMEKGADLSLFQDIPFSLNMPNFNSSLLLSAHLDQIGAKLNCVHVSGHPDLHHQMTARDYAASFCLTMYLPALFKVSERQPDNPLYVFPIRGFRAENPVSLSYVQNRVFPRYARALMKIVRRQCGKYKEYDLI